jgi:hypothetical protein
MQLLKSHESKPAIELFKGPKESWDGPYRDLVDAYTVIQQEIDRCSSNCWAT